MGEWGVIFDPHSVSLAGLKSSAYVRFSVLALSSIFFLVDPFAALPTFLAVTAGADAQRRRKMAWKASVTALVVLSAFAVAGQFIFKMFGITLPAFEIAGGVILLLIGLDMLEAKRSPTQESQRRGGGGRTEGGRGDCAAGDSDAGRAGRDHQCDGAGGAGADAVADGGDSGVDLHYRGDLLSGAGELRPRGAGAGRDRASGFWCASWVCCWSRWRCSIS